MTLLAPVADIHDIEQVCAKLTSMDPGDDVSIKIQRAGRRRTLRQKLGVLRQPAGE